MRYTTGRLEYPKNDNQTEMSEILCYQVDSAKVARPGVPVRVDGWPASETPQKRYCEIDHHVDYLGGFECLNKT